MQAEDILNIIERAKAKVNATFSPAVQGMARNMVKTAGQINPASRVASTINRQVIQPITNPQAYQGSRLQSTMQGWNRNADRVINNPIAQGISDLGKEATIRTPLRTLVGINATASQAGVPGAKDYLRGQSQLSTREVAQNMSPRFAPFLEQMLGPDQTVRTSVGDYENLRTPTDLAGILDQPKQLPVPIAFLGAIASPALNLVPDATDLVKAGGKEAGENILKHGDAVLDPIKALKTEIKTISDPKEKLSFLKKQLDSGLYNNERQYKSPIDALENSPTLWLKNQIVEVSRKINNPKRVTKTSNNLYHTTPAENLESIRQNGLTTGNKPRFEGVSSTEKISLAANEKGAAYYGGSDDVMIRTKRGFAPDDLDYDLLAGGEGYYRTGKNIPPEMLEVKVGGKWQPLKVDPLEALKAEARKYKSADEFDKFLLSKKQSGDPIAIKELEKLTQEANKLINAGVDRKKAINTVLRNYQDRVTLTPEKYSSLDEFLKSQGTPLHHGTDANFSEFSLKNFGKTDEGFSGKGVYLTGRKANAKQYGKNVIESYVKLENPFTYEDSYAFGAFSPQGLRERLGLSRNASAEAVTAELKRRGHDGIVINENTGKGIRKNEEVVVIDPSKIKTRQQLTDLYNQATAPKGKPLEALQTEARTITQSRSPAGFMDLTDNTFDTKNGKLVITENTPWGNSVQKLYVDETARRQGIATKLLEAAKQKYDQLSAQVSNKGSLELHYKAGFRPFEQPEATLSDSLKLFDENSSLHMVYNQPTKGVEAPAIPSAKVGGEAPKVIPPDQIEIIIDKKNGLRRAIDKKTGKVLTTPTTGSEIEKLKTVGYEIRPLPEGFLTKQQAFAKYGKATPPTPLEALKAEARGITDGKLTDPVTLKTKDGLEIPLKKTVRDVSYPGKERILQELEGKTPDGKFIGIRFYKDGNSLRIIGFSSESKGKGYGTELLNQVVADAKKSGIDSIIADDTHATNSLKYWEKQGFKDIGDANAELKLTDLYTQATAPKVNPLEALQTEARKYKSAEEFVKYVPKEYENAKAILRYGNPNQFDVPSRLRATPATADRAKAGMQPIIVKESIDRAGNKYTEVVDGWHRLASAKQAGLKQIPILQINESGTPIKSQLTDLYNQATAPKGVGDVQTETIQNIQKSIQEKYPNAIFDLSHDNGEAYLDMIALPYDKRGQGTGTKIMRDFVEELDKNKLNSSLAVGSREYEHDVPRLLKFYENFGYKPKDAAGRSETYVPLVRKYNPLNAAPTLPGTTPPVLKQLEQPKLPGELQLPTPLQKPSVATPRVLGAANKANTPAIVLTKKPYTFNDTYVGSGDAGDKGFAITANGKVVGGYHLTDSNIDGVKELSGLEILPEYQRSGYGLEAIKQMFLDKNAPHTLTGQGILQAKPFWDKVGMYAGDSTVNSELKIGKDDFLGKFSDHTVKNPPVGSGNYNRYYTGILDEAKRVAAEYNIDDPVAFAKELASRYMREEEVKKVIDDIADTYSHRFGGKTVKAPLKGTFSGGSDDFSRVVEKQAGGSLKDISRNTILLSDKDTVWEAVKDIRRIEKDVIYESNKDYFANPSYMGYRGVNLNYRDPKTGYLSEIQINIPEIMYVKMPPKEAKFFLTPEEIATMKDAGLEGGIGHTLYAKVRKYEKVAKREGRFTIEANGQEIFDWTSEEKIVVEPLIKQSNEAYEKAMQVADQNASTKRKPYWPFRTPAPPSDSPY